jgi:Oxidoreductase molybdopterin binding domain/Mo-co oxidoreductase dimerisation domain
VEQPTNLTYDALRSLPSVAQDQTLECISNEVGGNLISNAHWTGVRIADLLTSAGIKAGAGELIFRCADGYSDSLHLTQALGPRALVVYQINGQPLPKAHGFPARLLVPGLYGMKNGKWVTRLEVGAGMYQGGYWEQQGWSREARVKTMTRIDVPGNGDLLTPRPTVIAGVAFSGNRGISQVDVSVDGGRTWSAATLKRPLADQTWVLWELPWQPNTGSYVVTARAIDLAGFVQSPTAAPTLPDGASGYHAITVTVG